MEGYGLIREAFLPLYIELSNFGQIESGESLRDTLMLKTKNVYKYSYLAIW